MNLNPWCVFLCGTFRENGVEILYVICLGSSDLFFEKAELCPKEGGYIQSALMKILDPTS